MAERLGVRIGRLEALAAAGRRALGTEFDRVLALVYGDGEKAERTTPAEFDAVLDAVYSENNEGE